MEGPITRNITTTMGLIINRLTLPSTATQGRMRITLKRALLNKSHHTCIRASRIERPTRKMFKRALTAVFFDKKNDL